jgi:subfamily B ATP-binding cassette protein MsbA
MLRHYFIKTVRYKLVNNLSGLSYGAFLKMDAGKIQNTLTSDVARLFNTMTLYFGASQIFVMLCTYIVLAFLANYQFALLVVVGSVLSNLIYRKIFKTTKKASIELSKKGSDFNSYLIQAITYFKYLKSTNTFSNYAKKLKRVIDEAEMLNRKIGHMKAIANSVKEPIIITVVALVILAQISWMGTNLNTILLSLVLFYRALSFLVALQNEWHGFIENIGGMDAVSSLSEQMIKFQEPQGNKKFKAIEHSMRIKDVEFFYDSKKALSNININIPAKQTTLANMVAGLITPDEGGIYIDNICLNDIDLNSYRDKIGYISQESVIFNDSIFNNITFWADYTDENKKRFEEIVRMTSLTEFVASQPNKEFTNLGDNGILISGGQKQRISIARELFKKAEILIFDEATSALDSETEKIIQDNIEKLHGNHTMIVIAHRLSTIKKADIIFLLEAGKVTASGTFEEMVNKSSRFKKMVSLQAV